MGSQDPKSISPGFENKFISFVGKLGLLISFLIVPPVFTALFSVSGFVLNESKLLWVFSILLLLISLSQIIFPVKFKLSLSFLFFVILFFIIIELFTRSYVVLTYNDNEKEELGLFVNKTYDEFAIYKGHPFLAYTGNPGINYEVDGEIKRTTGFNNMGFVGNDFIAKKNKNVIRVACLGGSTTERGYPTITQYQLNKYFKDTLSFEVLNFGVSGWTTANSLTNYILNVREFNPDYVLIHHGWNEGRIRNTPKELFRSDYSHALTYFHEPEIIDKIPIRLSVLYRILKNKFSYAPDWVFLGDATTDKDRPINEQNYNNLDELKSFERNVKTIIDLSLIDESKVILSTQPFSLTKSDETSKTIEQGNEIMRKLFLSYDDQLLFLDLDHVATGNFNNIFKDLAHMNQKGIFYKGSEFARIIINNITKDSLESVPPYLLKNPISYYEYSNSIGSNKIERLTRKAQSKEVSLHSLIKKDAFNFLVRNNKNQPENGIFNYLYEEERIVSNVEWFDLIKIDAKEKNISVEENLAKTVKHILSK